jgi:transcription initiation factor IIF auxiliary subunit
MQSELKNDSQEEDNHKWTLYVSVARAATFEETSKYVKSVTYHLDSDFQPNTIKV